MITSPLTWIENSSVQNELVKNPTLIIYLTLLRWDFDSLLYHYNFEKQAVPDKFSIVKKERHIFKELVKQMALKGTAQHLG
ncbi:hypothetical protein RR46_09355 [Papilio xuthus]|uniref:Uncharacterized protein n=1 Tax=Papilio xuthus TaxID=66420 RepID=A0A194PWQ6_PAPXU|nr:hypothetical protein RR46_09355 [Papilio xuthus]